MYAASFLNGIIWTSIFGLLNPGSFGLIYFLFGSGVTVFTMFVLALLSNIRDVQTGAREMKNILKI